MGARRCPLLDTPFVNTGTSGMKRAPRGKTKKTKKQNTKLCRKTARSNLFRRYRSLARRGWHLLLPSLLLSSLLLSSLLSYPSDACTLTYWSICRCIFGTDLDMKQAAYSPLPTTIPVAMGTIDIRINNTKWSSVKGRGNQVGVLSYSLHHHVSQLVVTPWRFCHSMNKIWHPRSLTTKRLFVRSYNFVRVEL